MPTVKAPESRFCIRPKICWVSLAMRKHLRYLILLLILLFVVINEAVNKSQTTSWEAP